MRGEGQRERAEAITGTGKWAMRERNRGFIVEIIQKTRKKLVETWLYFSVVV